MRLCDSNLMLPVSSMCRTESWLPPKGDTAVLYVSFLEHLMEDILIYSLLSIMGFPN